MNILKPQTYSRMWTFPTRDSDPPAATPKEPGTSETVDGTMVKSSFELLEACVEAARTNTTDTRANTEHRIEVPAVDALCLAPTPLGSPMVQHYSVVPLPTKEKVSSYGLVAWQIELYGLGRGSDVQGFRVVDDVIIGRGSQADIRLDAYDAAHRGVSRRHAMLRPTRHHLYLIDLGSTNGTFLNTVPLSHAVTRPIEHNDMITLGQLSFAVRIIEDAS